MLHGRSRPGRGTPGASQAAQQLGAPPASESGAEVRARVSAPRAARAARGATRMVPGSSRGGARVGVGARCPSLSPSQLSVLISAVSRGCLHGSKRAADGTRQAGAEAPLHPPGRRTCLDAAVRSWGVSSQGASGAPDRAAKACERPGWPAACQEGTAPRGAAAAAHVAARGALVGAPSRAKVIGVIQGIQLAGGRWRPQPRQHR